MGKRPFQSLQFETRGNRPHQEDAAFASAERGFFVVADGFGGPVAGREASRIACESIREFLEKEAGDLEATLPFVLKSYYSLAGNVLFNAVLYANQRVRDYNKGKNVHEKAGASVIAGFLDGDLLAIANAGACSAHLFREHRSRELAQPRTLSRLMQPIQSDPVAGLDAPLISLGTYKDLEPEILEVRLIPGDWVLFQTDGVGESFRERLLGVQASASDATQRVPEIRSVSETAEYPENAAYSLLIYS